MRLQICSISSKSSPPLGSSVGSIPHSLIVPGGSLRSRNGVMGNVMGIAFQLDLFVPNRFIPFFLDPYGLPPSPFLVRFKKEGAKTGGSGRRTGGQTFRGGRIHTAKNYNPSKRGNFRGVNYSDGSYAYLD